MEMNKFTYDNAPSITRSRSVFDLSHSVHASLMHGDLRVVDCMEVLPGDTMEISVPLLNRMSSPIAPIMGNIYQEVFAFFVPLRLIWEHAEEFFGANKDSFGIQTTEYKMPGVSLSNIYDGVGDIMDPLGVGFPNYSVGFEFGIPAHIDQTLAEGSDTINELPLRAYCLIYNEFFRDQNLQSPFIIDFGDNVSGGYDITRDGNNFSYGSSPAKICKKRDRFTSALPFTQKGDPVRVPVGGLAPVKTAPDDLGYQDNSPALNFKLFGGSAVSGSYNVAVTSGGNIGKCSAVSGAVTEQLVPVNLFTDLSVATGSTVNELRLAFQTQRYLELLARGGTRYVEYLHSVFGVTNGDARLQRPEFLGGTSTRINIDQIMSTAGYQNGQTSQLGAVGAFSVTGSKNEYLVNKSFTEHGYILILTACRHERVYSEGFDPLLLKKRTLDIYNPAFAHIGETPVYTAELNAKASVTFKNGELKGSVFGFQEAWSEYRHLKNKTCGLLDPNVPNSLDYWTLAEKDVPALLNSDFLVEDRRAISRALTTGDTGPDYIVSYLIDVKAKREMPIHSIPGLIDHI